MNKLNKYLKVTVFLLLVVLGFSSCLKNNNEDPYAAYTPEREASLIKNWTDAMIKKKLNLDTTSTGIIYVPDTVKVGSGPTVKIGDSLTVKYTGMFLDGTVFDSSSSFKYVHKDKNPLKRLIQGWEEGIEILRKGGSAAFLIPSAKAYGADGRIPSIPPYSPLIFIIEVVDIK